MKSFDLALQMRAAAATGHKEAEALHREADMLDAALSRYMNEGSRDACENLLRAQTRAHARQRSLTAVAS